MHFQCNNLAIPECCTVHFTPSLLKSDLGPAMHIYIILECAGAASQSNAIESIYIVSTCTQIILFIVLVQFYGYYKLNNSYG